MFLKLALIYSIVFPFFFQFSFANEIESPSSSETSFNNNIQTTRISGFTISAEELDRDLEKNILNLTGQVKISYKDQIFTAQQVQINFNTKTAILKGSVQILNSEMEIGGDEIQLDYLSDQALIVNGYIQSNNIRFQGQILEQQSKKDFFVINADYTTCNNCPSTWSFDGSQINAELGGYAFIKNAFLKVGGIPLFWLPYLIVPLKNERQTGLLPPEFGYNQNRNSIFHQSFFWAIDRSQDMTFGLKSYELGGLKQLVEYRYALAEQSYGQINMTHMSDSVFKSSDNYNYFRESQFKNNSFNRWMFKSYLQHDLDPSTRLRMQTQLVSDLQYPKDFFDEFTTYSDSGLENSFSLTQSNDLYTNYFNITYFKHLLESNPLADNSSTVHKLPELKTESQWINLKNSPLYFKWGATGTQFYRKKDYDDLNETAEGQRFLSNSTNNPRCDNLLDPNGLPSDCQKIEDGLFDENRDLLRTGQRLQFFSTLTTTALPLGSIINVTPQIGYYRSNYFFPVGLDRNLQRQYIQLDILSRSKLYRIYDFTTDENAIELKKKYKHEFIPEITYTLIPWIDQEAHTFYGFNSDQEAAFSSRTIVSDSNLTTDKSIQFDYEDRIYERHLLTLTLLNRVVRKKMIDSSYKTTFDFRLSQSYDLYQASSGENKGRPLSNLTGTTNLYLDEVTLSNQFYYNPYLYGTDSSSTLTYLNSHQQYFKIGYNSKRIEDPKQDDVSLAIGFVTNYLNLLTGVVIDTSENRQADSRLKKHSLIAQFKPPGECWAINFYRDQKVGRGAEWKIKLEFSFDGKPTKVIPPAELNIN